MFPDQDDGDCPINSAPAVQLLETFAETPFPAAFSLDAAPASIPLPPGQKTWFIADTMSNVQKQIEANELKTAQQTNVAYPVQFEKC